MKQLSTALALVFMATLMTLNVQAAGGDDGIEAREIPAVRLFRYTKILDQLNRLRVRSNRDLSYLSTGIDEIQQARTFLLHAQLATEGSFEVLELIDAYFKGLHLLNRELSVQPDPEVTRISSQEFLQDLRSMGFLTSIETLEQKLYSQAAFDLSVYGEITYELSRSCRANECDRNDPTLSFQIPVIQHAQERLGRALENGDEEELRKVGNDEELENAIHEVLAENFRGLRMINRRVGLEYVSSTSDQDFLKDLQKMGIFTTLEMLESLLEDSALP